MLRFNDGMEFDLSGPSRAVKKRDGWYVVGNGMLMAVDSYEEAQQVIAEENARNDKK